MDANIFSARWIIACQLFDLYMLGHDVGTGTLAPRHTTDLLASRSRKETVSSLASVAAGTRWGLQPAAMWLAVAVDASYPYIRIRVLVLT